MGIMDGEVIGLTTILDNGPVSERWNLVVVAEGFQLTELSKFHDEVNKFIEKLLSTTPFSDLSLGINVHQLDVASTESGADEPSGGECTGSGVMRDTYFDAAFCAGGLQRRLGVNVYLVLEEVAKYLPEYDEVLVCVNSDTYGGGGGGVSTYSLGYSPITGKGAVEIAIHELGHSAFGLRDEYAYGASADSYVGAEPMYPNITANAEKSTIKWKDLILGSTPVPTQKNQDCSQEDTNPSAFPVGTVGAFEGAGYHHCGLFRPEFNCQMRELENPFCAVCEREIRNTLEPFVPVFPPAVNIGALAWAWIIVVGGLMITPGGVECIVCGPFASKLVGVISVAVGVAAFVTYKKKKKGPLDMPASHE